MLAYQEMLVKAVPVVVTRLSAPHSLGSLPWYCQAICSRLITFEAALQEGWPHDNNLPGGPNIVPAVRICSLLPAPVEIQASLTCACPVRDKRLLANQTALIRLIICELFL